jgi:hemerythrin-like domain-containing protein
MSRPSHLLRHEHRVIEQALRALDGMCARLRTGGHVPATEMSRLLAFFQEFADGFHHAKEETLLFPTLEQIGIRNEDGPLAFLRQEHEVERRLLGEVAAAVVEYHRDPAGGRFIAAALQFKDNLLGHMQHEDAILFRLAEEVLEDEAKDALIRALADANDKARSLIERYEQMAAELERTWAI